MLLILVPKITRRLRYIFRLMFGNLCGAETILTTNSQEFEAFQGAKFVYGSTPFDGSLWFESSKLLFETGVKSGEVHCIDYNGIKCLFSVYNPASALPYDPFAAAFFMVTRYEEYLPHTADQHGRFKATESLAFRYGFLMQPVVNIWMLHIKQLLSARYTDIGFRNHQYRFIPTYDIDQAWAYRHKGMIRNTAAIIRLACEGKYNLIDDRVKVLTGRRADPFDTYDIQFALQREFALKPVYFILFSGYSKYDRNITVSNQAFTRLIQLISDYAEVGIHPSYASNHEPELLQREIKALSAVLKKEITSGRQHYLKLHLPETYRNLDFAGIRNDFTMGFADQPGFRAGICTPYRFYDLDLEDETRLVVYPFSVMDGTLKDYMGLHPEVADEIVASLIDQVKKVNGTFISLWHNASLSNRDEWQGWKAVYYRLVAAATQ